ncbi:MAG TPA: Flp pilus assembly protein CpaB [Polyangiaceae bacterium]|jgi:pilus assembly protein CpaB|nr:Flp pilus assembly protein CpaB [Polyangiaceae bacterium]
MKFQPVLFGLLAGAAGVALLVMYMHRFEADVAGGRRVTLLVAAGPIQRGKPITAELLGTRDVPIAYADDRSIRDSERDKIIGLRATTNVPVEQTISWTDVIAMDDEQRDLSALVQPGNRAMPIKVGFEEEIPLIRPGDFVDIIAVYSDTHLSSVLLQRVLVLASGHDTSNLASDKRGHFSTVTVSVSLPESQLLALAMQRGLLTVVIRSPQDQSVAEAPPDVSPQTLAGAETTPRPVAVSPHHAVVAPIKLEPDTKR